MYVSRVSRTRGFPGLGVGVGAGVLMLMRVAAFLPVTREQRLRIQPTGNVGDSVLRSVEPGLKEGGAIPSVSPRIKDGRRGIEPLELSGEPRDRTFLGEIGFRQDQPVGHGHLAASLFMGLERRRAIHRIDDGDQRIDDEAPRQIGMQHERVEDRRGIGEARRLDQHAIERTDAALSRRRRNPRAPSRARP